MSKSENPSPNKLTEGEAASRIVVVVLIQSTGLLLVILPLIGPASASVGWQRSCLWFGSLAGIGWVVLFCTICLILWRFAHSDRFSVSHTELMIMLAFVLNTTALSLAMVRTGGPSCSVFGQMIPMQLAGILLLEQQKATFTKARSYRPAVYSAITLLIWGSAVIFSQQLADWRKWSLTGGADENGYGILSTSRLILFEIVFMAVAYFLPQRFSSRNAQQETS